MLSEHLFPDGRAPRDVDDPARRHVAQDEAEVESGGRRRQIGAAMARFILWCSNQAVGWLTPSCRFIARSDRPVWAWLIECIARNQRVNGSLVLPKNVPAVSEVWRRQVWHWYRMRPPQTTMQCVRPSQRGQATPSDQRALRTTSAPAASVPKH